MCTRLILPFVLVGFLATAARAEGPATSSTTAPAPAMTERQASLLLQLSEAEANIKTINQALVRTGYKVGLAYEKIESGQGGNELMDRKGGGPVGWEQFYGSTAAGFYYHSSAELHYDKAHGNTTLDYQANGSRLTKIDRPRQFDFIYHANDDQIIRAKEQIASLAQNQAGLLARRQQHEANQMRLWAVFSWEQVRDQEIGFRPLYRFKLQPDGIRVQVLRGPILFLRTADKALESALDSIGTQPDMTFALLQQRMKAAYAALQQSMADVLYSPQLGVDDAKEGDAIKTLGKNVTEECTVIAENYQEAIESDAAREDASKLAYRGQLQSSLARLSTMLSELDSRITRAADAWHIVPTAGAASADALPVWPPSEHVAGHAPVAVVAPPPTPGIPSPIVAGNSLLDSMNIKFDADCERRDGEVRITTKPHRFDARLDTAAEYRTPLVITAVAKTSSKDLRLFYGDRGVVILNWEVRPSELRHHDPKSGHQRGVQDNGEVPADTWVTVRWTIGESESRVEVNGEQRGNFKGDYQDLSGRVGIGTHGNNVVTVKSLTVDAGPGAVGAAPAPAAN